ncbi:MAG: epoxyqueuosine reductase [Thermoleophilia bacterium]|nr:epoxyqueuosine reductase [Thermoleophilia bacterium]
MTGLMNDSLKKLAAECGADLCGIAPVERFADAPAGFHPHDVFPGARSVVAFAVRMPDSGFASRNPVPYTFFATHALDEVSRITYELVARLDRMGVVAVPVPSQPYEYWDASTMTGKGIISLRHIAAAAGLGTITRNHLLTGRRYGNRVALGAVLLDVEVAPDPPCLDPRCPDGCNLCRDYCPVGAISDKGVDQKLCRSVAEGLNERGFYLYWCRVCREKCPLSRGEGDPEPAAPAEQAGSPTKELESPREGW